MIHSTVRPLLYEQKAAEPGDPPSSSVEEQRRSPLQEPAGFGDSKWGRVPETETLGHSPAEHGVRQETRGTGVSDCFSLRAHQGVGPRALSSRAREWEAAIFIPIL